MNIDGHHEPTAAPVPRKGPPAAPGGAAIARPGLALAGGGLLLLFFALLAAAAALAWHQLSPVQQLTGEARRLALPGVAAVRRQALDLAERIAAVAAPDGGAEPALAGLEHLRERARTLPLAEDQGTGIAGAIDAALDAARELLALERERRSLEAAHAATLRASLALSAALRAVLQARVEAAAGGRAAATTAQGLALLSALQDLRPSLANPAGATAPTPEEIEFLHTRAPGLLRRLAAGHPGAAGVRLREQAPVLDRLHETLSVHPRLRELHERQQDLRAGAEQSLRSAAARLSDAASTAAAAGLASIDAATVRARWLLALALGWLVLGCLSCAYLARRWLLAPLRRYALILEDLGAGAERPPLPASPLRELAQIGRSIEHCDRRLAEMQGLNQLLAEETEQHRRSRLRHRQAEAQTQAAIESMGDGFVLFDRDDRLLLCNSAFREIYPLPEPCLRPGTDLRELLRQIRDAALIRGVEPGDADWLEAECARHRNLESLPERQLEGSRWVSLRLFRTAAGGTVSIHRNISPRKHAEQALQRRNDLIQLMRDLAVLTSEVDSLERALQICVERICAFSGFDVGHAYAAAAGEDPELRSGAVWHSAVPERFEDFRAAARRGPISRGIGLPGRVWDSGDPLWLTDLGGESDHPRARAATSAGLRSGFAFPVIVQDRVAAVLEFYAARPIPPDRALLDALPALSVQLGRLTERVCAADQLRKLFRAVEQSPSAVLMTDAQGRIEYVNPRFVAMTGYGPEETLGRTPSLLGAGEVAEGQIQELWHKVGAGQEWRGEIRHQRKNGEVYWAETSVSPVRDERGKVTHFIGIADDISERKKTEQRIEHLAFYDELTNLPNRAYFNHQLRQQLSRARREKSRFAVLLLDLDDFRDVNDSISHDTGDVLLQRVTGRLSSALRECDMLARLGGDEFAMLLVLDSDPTPAANVAKRAIEAISKPFVLERHEIYISASVGICTFPEDGRDQRQLLKNAELALYRGKARGKGQYQFYSPELDANVRNRKSLENELRNAIGRSELCLWYQPQVNLRTGRIIGAEALMRWCHPKRGVIGPGEFVPIAEQSGLIVSMGEWALREACRQIADWRASGLPPATIAVNVSAVQFQHRNLLETVRRAVSHAGIEPRWLCLEITESVVMQQTDDNLRVLNALRNLGVRVALDDFGTGYSSLSYLNRFPIDKIKIDRSFVRRIVHDPVHRAVVGAVVDLGKVLRVKVNVEGVETEDQLRVVGEQRVDEVQGFYFSKPVPPEELVRLLDPSRPALRNPHVA